MKNIKKYLIHKNENVKQALIQLNELSDDTLNLFVIDDDKKLIGTVTDGDIRRALISGISLNDRIEIACLKTFKAIYEGIIDVNFVKKNRQKGILLLPVLNKNGQIEKIYDLKKAKNILPADAVIMAGGRGERLRPLTDTVPKPLLKIGDKPIIDYNVDNLIKNGVESFFITTNYLANQIEQHFESKHKENETITCIKEDKPLGTIGSVRLLYNLLAQDSVLVMNSDLFTNIDIEDFYLDFIKEEADMSIAAIPYNVSIPYAILNLENNYVKSFKEKPTYTYYANAGIYLIKKELLKLIPDGEFFDATDLIEMLIEKQKKVIKYPLVGYWIDIGKPEDYKKAQEFTKYIKQQ